MLKIVETKSGFMVHFSGCDEIAFAVVLFLLDKDFNALTTGNRKLLTRAIDCFLDGGTVLSQILCFEMVGLWRYRTGRSEPIYHNDLSVPISTDPKATRARRRLIWKLIHQPSDATLVTAPGRRGRQGHRG